MYERSRCKRSEVIMCSLVFPVFCFHFCTKHQGIDRAQWPVHFYAVPALFRELHPWPCDGFSINPCCFLQHWKLPYCMKLTNVLSKVAFWDKTLAKKAKTKMKQQQQNQTKAKQHQARGLFSVFRLQSVITGRKHLRISPVEDVLSPGAWSSRLQRSQELLLLQGHLLLADPKAE